MERNEARTEAKGRKGRWPRGLGFAAGSFVLALLAVELVLRLAWERTDSYRVWTPHLETHFRPQPDAMPGIEGLSVFRINALGFRGAERPSSPDLSILAIGGSTTECLYLDQSETWPELLDGLLEAKLGAEVWVANAGVSGRNLRDHLVQLEHLMAQAPAFDVVLMLFGLNDFMLRLARDDAFDPHFMDHPDAEQRLLARAFVEVPLERDHVAWFKRTALFRLLRATRLHLAPGNTEQDSAGATYATWRANRTNAKAWRTVLPDLGEALAEYRRNLVRAAECIEAAGARCVFATQPAIWSDPLPDGFDARLWMGWVGESQNVPGLEYYTVAALRKGLDRYNRITREVAQERGAHLIDLAQAMDGDPRWFYDDVHLTEAGARHTAQLLADAW